MELVKNEPRVITKPGGFRSYDGFPSVTTVLGQIYRVHTWLGQQSDRPGGDCIEDLTDPVMAAYRTRGRYVHKACALCAEGRLDWNSLDPDIRLYVEAFKDWLSQSGLKFQRAEVSVVSKKYGYGGRLDFLFGKQKDGWVVDLKVGASGSDPFVGMQVEAYRKAIAESETELLLRRRGVLWLTAKGLGVVWRFQILSDPTDWRDFVFALGAYRAAVARGYIKEV